MAELLFFAFAFVAEVIGTMVGFGTSTIFLPLALFFIDFKAALILVAIFHLFGTFGRLTFFRQGIDKRLAIAFGIPSVLFTIIGALLVNFVPQELLKFVLGIFLFFFSINSIFWREPKLAQKNANAVLGGSASGFIVGLIGTGGAIRSAF